MAEEIELKLALSPQDLERLRRHPSVRNLARGPSKRQRLVSIYFDTPEESLRQQGAALRVRRIGRRRVQTLKMPPGKIGKRKPGTTPEGVRSATNGMQMHREFEADITGNTPDLGKIDKAAVRELRIEQDVAARLQPVFETDIDRRTLVLAMAGAEIELALDKGMIRSDGQELPICEAELELLSGAPEQLYELALLLSERIPFRIEMQTKAERGFTLGTTGPAQPTKGGKPTLVRDQPVAAAFEAVVASCLAQMRGNELAVFEGQDPEGVHQMRVAIRRLRAALSLFGEVVAPDVLEFLKEELRWLQGTLGDARDWDVFLLETVAPLLRRLPEEESLQALRQASQAARDEAYEAAWASLREPRYTRFLLRLNLWLERGDWRAVGGSGETHIGDRPLFEHACRLLQRRARKLKRLGRNHAAMSEAELHEVRIAGKKLRYAIEFFRDLYPSKSVKRYLSHLVGLQDTLGSLNDAVTAHRLTGLLEAAAAEAGQPAPAYASGVVTGWQAARIEADLSHFQGAWAEFAADRPFWRGRRT